MSRDLTALTDNRQFADSVSVTVTVGEIRATLDAARTAITPEPDTVVGQLAEAQGQGGRLDFTRTATIEPRTEAGRAFHDERHVNRDAPDPCRWLRDVLAIEAEATLAPSTNPGDGLDVETLAKALWAWGYDDSPFIRDDVKEPTEHQRRMARKLAAEYARLLGSKP